VAICTKALSADPAHRYQSVQEFQRDLERYVRGLAQLPQRTFKAGEAIITEGEPGDAAYVIVSGDCVATRIVGGQPQGLRLLKAGDMFGEAAVFTGQPRSATVRAVTDTVVGVVDHSAMREEMERTSFMSLAIRTVASTFLDLDRQLARQRQQGRVIEFALRHVALHGERGRTPWKPLLAMLTQSTGAGEADVSSWVLGAVGVTLEGESLVLHA
jgi:CRP-like cAMP-binding protein